MGKTIVSLWVDSCIRPRELIKEIIEHDPTHLMWTNIFIAVLATSALMMVSEDNELSTILPVLLAPVGILFYIFIYAWLLVWTGKLLGGTANSETFRAVLIWSMPASILSNFIEHLYRVIVSDQTSNILMFIHFIGLIWITSISIRFISQVQDFHIGRAASNFLLPIFFMMIIGVVAAIFIPMFR